MQIFWLMHFISIKLKSKTELYLKNQSTMIMLMKFRSKSVPIPMPTHRLGFMVASVLNRQLSISRHTKNISLTVP